MKADVGYPEIFRDSSIKLFDGRTLNIFFNRATELLVVDVLDADENGGNEFVRINVPPAPERPAKKRKRK